MMADGVLQRTRDPVVEHFAQKVEASQMAEIEAMQETLEERGAEG